MLRYLICRETGFHPPQVLATVERARRTFSLELSKTRDIYSSHQGAINCMHLDSAQEKYLLCGGADCAISIFDVEGSKYEGGKECIKPIHRITSKEGHKYGVSCVSWYNHDNGLFFSGSFDTTVRVWDPNEMKTVMTWQLDGKVYSLALHPTATGHSLVAVGTEDQKGRLCDVRSGNKSHSLIGHREAIRAVKWCPSNEFLLVTGSVDQTIRFWDIRMSGCLMSLDQHAEPETAFVGKRFHVGAIKQNSVATAHNGAITGLTFTPDGRYLLSTGTDGKLREWDASTGLNTLVNYSSTKNYSRGGTQLCVSANGAVVFHPNGNDIHQYRVHNGEMLPILQGHYDKVNCCVFHPSRDELYSGGNDFMILVWSPSVEEKAEEEELSDDSDNWSDGELP